MDDQGNDAEQATRFHYHLELTPAQLKITHTALHSLLDGFGHDEPEVRQIVQEVLAKLPDEHAIRAIRLDHEGAEAEARAQPSDTAAEESPPPDQGPPPSAA
jgi:hypothetical protein